MIEEMKFPFCVKKVERLAERQFFFELCLSSGKMVTGEGRLEQVPTPNGTIEIGDFDLENIASHKYSHEIDTRKLVSLMKVLSSLDWYD